MTMADWHIFQPSDPSKPIHQILSGIQRGGFYVVNDNDQETSRQALLDALSSAGYPAPSPSDPVYVHRTDTGNLERNTGNGWSIYPEPVPDTDWVDLPLQGGWDTLAGSGPQARKIDGWVHPRGEVFGGGTGSASPISTLPDGMRPERRLRMPWGWPQNELQVAAYIVIEPDGRIYANGYVRSTSPGMFLEAIPPFWAGK